MDPDKVTRDYLVKHTFYMIRRYGIRPRRWLGQNFIIEPKFIKEMLDAAGIGKGDVVLEVGAGLGTLTAALAQRCKKVIAVEVDPSLVRVLRKSLQEDNVEIIQADILEYDPPSVDKVVSNVPYSIASPFTEKLLKDIKFKLAALTYQLEFAKRLYARPGYDDYSRLTILANYYASVEPVRVVPPTYFVPRPRVFSELLRIRPREVKPFVVHDEELFFSLVRTLFSQRRRVLRQALRHALRNLGLGESLWKHALDELSDYAPKRIYELAPEEFARISNVIWHLMNS